MCKYSNLGYQFSPADCERAGLSGACLAGLTSPVNLHAKTAAVIALTYFNYSQTRLKQTPTTLIIHAL